MDPTRTNDSNWENNCDEQLRRIPAKPNGNQQDPASDSILRASVPANPNATEQDPSLQGQDSLEVPDSYASFGRTSQDNLGSSCLATLPEGGIRQPKFEDMLESANACEQESNIKRALPQLTQMLKSEELSPRLDKFVKEYISTAWKTDWQSADFTFLNTHTVRVLESDETRQVNPQALSSHSLYFKAAFLHGDSMSLEVTLGWLAPVAPEVLRVIDWMNDTRDCRLEITGENSLNMFMAVDFLACDQLLSRCKQFIQRRCDDSTMEALNIFQLLFKYFPTDLLKLSLKSLLININSLHRNGHLRSLDVNELEFLFKQDMLNCRIELDVLRIIESWWIYRKKWPSAELLPQLDRLLCCVRFEKMKNPEIKMYQSRRMPLTYQPYFRDRLAGGSFSDTKFYEQFKEQMHGLCENRQPHQVVLLISCPKMSQSRRELLAYCMYVDPNTGQLLDGPSDGRKVSHVVDPELASQPYPESATGSSAQIFCISTGNKIFVVGGSWARSVQRKVLLFDRERPELGWTVCSRLLVSRFRHCCAVLHGHLYAIGGIGAQDGRLKIVERFAIDKLSSRWSLVEPMLCARFDAAAVEHRGRLFVAGGVGLQYMLTTAEIFCPTSGTWTLVPGRMPKLRKNLCAVSVGDAVYCVCGEKPSDAAHSIDRWREREGWDRFSQNLESRRHSFGCVAIDGRILLFGGLDKQGTVDSVEFLDVEDNSARPVGLLSSTHRDAEALKLRFVKQPIPGSVRRMSACVLDVALSLDS